MKGIVVKGLAIVTLLGLAGIATSALARDGGDDPVDIATTELVGDDLIQALNLPKLDVESGEEFHPPELCDGPIVELGDDLYCIPLAVAPTEYEQWKVGQQVRGHLPSGADIEEQATLEALIEEANANSSDPAYLQELWDRLIALRSASNGDG